MKLNREDLKSLSDKDLLDLRNTLVTKHNQYSTELKVMNIRLGRIKQELHKRRGERDKPFVSDHAVLRYLERVEGLNIEAVREFIQTRIPPDAQITEHNSIVLKDCILKISKDHKAIATIISSDMTETNEEGNNEGPV